MRKRNPFYKLKFISIRKYYHSIMKLLLIISFLLLTTCATKPDPFKECWKCLEHQTIPDCDYVCEDVWVRK